MPKVSSKRQNILFEDSQTVWRALGDYSKARPVKVGSKKKRADLPDALIVNKVKYQAQAWQARLSGVYTFDRAVCELPGTLSP